MTRSEVLEGVQCFSDLWDFANEEGYSFDNVYYVDDVDIDDDLGAVAGDWSWESIRDALDNLELNYYSFYRCDGYLDYVCVDDEWEDYLEEFVDYMDEGGYWDEEEDDEEWEDEDADDFYCAESVIITESATKPAESDLMSIGALLGIGE